MSPSSRLPSNSEFVDVVEEQQKDPNAPSLTRFVQVPSFVIPRGPKWLFEWVMSVVMVGCLFWPIVFGKPLHSNGSDFLTQAGLSTIHLGNFLGFLGFTRLGFLTYYGKFFGICPWARAAIALVSAFIWAEFLVATAQYTHLSPEVSIAVPLYFGIVIGELLCIHRAVLDVRDLRSN